MARDPSGNWLGFDGGPKETFNLSLGMHLITRDRHWYSLLKSNSARTIQFYGLLLATYNARRRAVDI